MTKVGLATEMELLSLQSEMREKNSQIQILQSKYDQLDENFQHILKNHKMMLKMLTNTKQKLEAERKMRIEKESLLEEERLKTITMKGELSSYSNLQREIETLRAMNEKLSGALLQEKKQFETPQLLKMENQINTLKQKLKEAGDVIQKQNNDILRIREELEQKKTLEMELRAQTTQKEEEYKSQIRKMEEAFQAQLASLQKELEEKKSSISEREKNIREREEHFEEIQEKLSTKENEIQELNSKIEEIEKKLKKKKVKWEDKFEKQKAKYLTAEENAKRKFDDKETMYKTQLENKEKKIEKLLQKLAFHEDELAKARDELSRAKDQLGDTNNKLLTMKGKMEFENDGDDETFPVNLVQNDNSDVSPGEFDQVPNSAGSQNMGIVRIEIKTLKLLSPFSRSNGQRFIADVDWFNYPLLPSPEKEIINGNEVDFNFVVDFRIEKNEDLAICLAKNVPIEIFISRKTDSSSKELIGKAIAKPRDLLINKDNSGFDLKCKVVRDDDQRGRLVIGDLVVGLSSPNELWNLPNAEGFLNLILEDEKKKKEGEEN